MEYDYSFTNKEVTPWGGMVFLRQFLQQMGFSKQVAECDALPQPGSNRGYDITTLLEAFICSVWCGANRFMHTEITRSDTALGKIFGWESVPGQDAYKRFFGKFTETTNLAVGDYFYKWIFDNYRFDNYTLDFDSTVITRYGKQQGAHKGYNSHKRGRASHHPLIAFVSDLNLVANMWLRSGDASASNNFLSFLQNTLDKLQNKKVSLIRLDSGFFSGEIMDFLESYQHNYVIAVKFVHPIQRIIDSSNNWIVLDDGIEICEQRYKAESWKQSRRIVIVRQKIEVRENAPGKLLSLFPEDETHRNYRYSAYVTNLDFAPCEVWRLYRGRGEAENRIKELKYDFGFDSFNLKGFYATEAALTFAMIAYNLMVIFRTFVLQEKTQKRLSTLRYRTFAIGAYFENIKGKLTLRISLTKKRRKWFDSLWGYTIQQPLKISNA